MSTLLGFGCIKQPQVVRLDQETGIATAYVYDRIDRLETEAVPEELSNRYEALLSERNLAPARQDAGLVEGFSTKRNTSPRLKELAGRGAPLVLLVEHKVSFYSQLSGRYRWTVNVVATAARSDALDEAVSARFEAPVFLSFDHEKEPEALVAAGPMIERRLRGLLDEFLAGMPQAGSPEPSDAAGDGPSDGADGGGSDRTAAWPLPSPDGDAIYFVLLDRFRNGHPVNDGDANPADPLAFHGGDVRGLIEKIDYLHDLGIRSVWISPVMEMRTEPIDEHGAFHGYWVRDHLQPEERLGTWEELRALSDRLHDRGMRLVLDMVTNHVGYDAPLVTERPDWFHDTGDITDWNDPVQLVTHKVHGLPDLAQEKPEVYDYLVRASDLWIDKVRPDAFRLDAVRHVPMDFLSRYTAGLHERWGGDFETLGEVFDGNPRSLAGFAAEAGFDAAFDFPLYYGMKDVFCEDAPAVRLAGILSADLIYRKHGLDPARMVTFLDNHDLPRITSACGGDLERVRSALDFMTAVRGIPSFTYGTEAAMTGLTETEARASMDWSAPMLLKDDIRDGLARRRGFEALTDSTDRLWQVGPDGSWFSLIRVNDDSAAVIVVNRSDDRVEAALPEELAGAQLASAQGRPTGMEIGPDGKVALEFDETVIAGTSVAAPSRSVRVHLLRALGDQDFSGLVRRLVRMEERTVRLRATAAGAGEPRLVGSLPELGAWDPDRALRGSKLQGDVWDFAVDLPVGSLAEYKLIRVAADGAVTWEDVPNRWIFVGEGDSVLAAEARWGQTR